ncbi:MAG: peptide deformylase [Thermoprotei archaeon]|nr:MAG: peptide deformylase [Thermoprotei archaeon]
MKIVTYPDPVLKKKTAKAKEIGEEELNLVREMIETMLENEGVGLAANQVGVSKSVFVASPSMKREDMLVLFNPRIVEKRGWIEDVEGCLSLPGISAIVKRANTVVVEGLNINGKKQAIKATGLLARFIQHDVDHLNGKLFIHHIPFRQRKKLLKIYFNKCG